LSAPKGFEVDDLAFAFQLRMAGIPVYISTEMARQMLSLEDS